MVMDAAENGMRMDGGGLCCVRSYRYTTTWYESQLELENRMDGWMNDHSFYSGEGRWDCCYCCCWCVSSRQSCATTKMLRLFG